MSNRFQSNIDEINYFINEYIKIPDFNKLYNKFSTIPYADKYMLLAFVACIEIHSIIDLKAKSCNSEMPCNFVNIYNYAKSNEDYHDFIIKYFNMWHGNEYDCFKYDKYHKIDLESNLKKIISLIKEDINNLKNIECKKPAKEYIRKYDALMNFISA